MEFYQWGFRYAQDTRNEVEGSKRENCFSPRVQNLSCMPYYPFTDYDTISISKFHINN